MRHLLHKLLLFVPCCYAFMMQESSTFTLALTLIAFSAAFYGSSRDLGKWHVGTAIFFAFLSITFPGYGIYLPLFLYDLISWKKSRLYYGCISGAVLLIGTQSAFCISKNAGHFLIYYSFLIIVSALLSLYTKEMETNRTQIYHLKDESKEKELLYKQRNQALIKNQDNEIHLATLTERNRIAREIHDNVGHMLTRSILQTGALKVINKDDMLKEPLDTLSDTLNTAMTSIRNSVHDLHDESIDLRTALEDLISPIETPSMMLFYDADNEVPKNIKYAFIAITKEAIQNIQKHSNATKASVRISEHPGFYNLYIEDNGTVASIENERSGIGLTNMKDRVQALNGTIRFDTTDGFKIRITIMK